MRPHWRLVPAISLISVGAAFADAPRVATDIAPVHSLVARVMEGIGSPSLVIDPGTSPHNAALRPSAAAALENADLVVWDPKKTKTIAAAAQQSAIDYNVFEGKEVTGLPRFTLTRGHVAVHDGEIRTQEGHGEFVARDPNQAVTKALSTWKELTAPRPVERTGIPATGV